MLNQMGDHFIRCKRIDARIAKLLLHKFAKLTKSPEYRCSIFWVKLYIRIWYRDIYITSSFKFICAVWLSPIIVNKHLRIGIEIHWIFLNCPAYHKYSGIVSWRKDSKMFWNI